MRSVAALLLLLCATPALALRVVTLSPHLAELVCAAGGCGQLIGVSAYSDYPPSVKALPRIGNGFSFDYERILALRPDRVYAWDGGTPPDTIARLKGLGLHVVAIKAGTLDDVASALERLGSDLGTAPVAEAAAKAYRKRLARLRARWADARPIRVAYQIGTDPAFSVNRHSPISAAITLCGGVNVFADMPQLAAPIGAEAMLAAQPQVVLYGSSEDPASLRAYWARLPGAFAPAHDSLYPVNADWLARATPRLLDGVQQVCEILDRARQSLAAVSAGKS